jgi:hypothetical protein
MQKYVIIALFSTTVSFGAQTDVVPAQKAIKKQYAALMMHTQHEATTWSFVPSKIEENWKRLRIDVAALLDEPGDDVPLSHEFRTLYKALFDTECFQDSEQNMQVTTVQPEHHARFKRGYRGGFRGHGYTRGHKRPGRRYVRQPKKSA